MEARISWERQDELGAVNSDGDCGTFCEIATVGPDWLQVSSATTLAVIRGLDQGLTRESKADGTEIVWISPSGVIT